jgi:hypothetical protein
MTNLTGDISDPVTWGEPEQVNPNNVLLEGDRLPVDEDVVAALMATIKCCRRSTCGRNSPAAI